MTKTLFMRNLLGAMEMYDKTLSQVQANIWISSIEGAGISWDDAIKAIGLHIQNPENGRFAPKPADIIKHIHGTSTDKRQQLEAEAVTEWGRVKQALGTYGTYDSVVFDNPRTMQAVKSLGGWPSLGAMKTDDMQYMTGDFRRVYVECDPTKCPSILPGKFHNEDGRIRYIGDESKCKAIQTSGTKYTLKGGDSFDTAKVNEKLIRTFALPSALVEE